METEWIAARMKLYQLMQQAPGWSNRRLAEALKRSLSWVKKWKQRFRVSQKQGWQLFLSESHAPKQARPGVSEAVRRRILSLREELREVYHRLPGPKLIQYHLPQDEQLQALGGIPRSTHTIWRVLKGAGRIPSPVRVEHDPVERPGPLEEWELDFGVADWIDAAGCEFAVVVDRGTSILVNTQVQAHYNAESVLNAVSHLLLTDGLPQRLRFDRDPRFVGSAQADGYPSAFVRFLRCLGIEPVICPPRRPDRKPFVERCIRTVKHECLHPQRPRNRFEAENHLHTFQHFYTAQRPNQALSCENRPLIRPTRPCRAWRPYRMRSIPMPGSKPTLDGCLSVTLALTVQS